MSELLKTISIAVMVKDEALMLDDCLRSCTWADEIVVLDSGSTDNTLEIAQRYTDKVHVSGDWQGFGAQRQRLHELCSGDWVLMVDADERVTPEFQAEVEALRKDTAMDRAFDVTIQTYIFGKALSHGGWCSTSRRLYPRLKGGFDPERKVHERMIFSEPVRFEKTKGRLKHFSYRDMEHYLVKSARYAAVFAEQKVARGKSATLSQAALHALGLFIKMYLIRGGFLDGRRGLLMAMLSSHSCFVKYADLWSRTKALR
ncbi:MAG: glycosyltransferase family 2 protein [Motiliproteus sp.]